ncbi:YhgE/Pip domain-containing protein [Viridibacillus sp. YIM B01967]|uniref:YhgE/Pip domain-containing protein n=1 Tax=Viridibacillus soli TaxID=2798301 RepID=A0ABS1H9K0_9BACL|nr:YhgE/Pip domain-containing protein [Viridibacillus soli]MBK3495974.1 YhgE/Pip domain-containing protein [Viridibacillus soli]
MIKAEFAKILRTKKMLIAVIAVLFVPVLYAGMFLWAFWDPYANLQDMPVALVNNDKGAEIDGEKKTLGDDLVENLVDSKEFKFVEVSEAKGEEGLEGRDYYILIEIPENFSKNAGTLLEDSPEQMKIIYRPNEGFNFLSGQIGNTAMELVRAEVNKKVSATYAETLFDNIAKLGDGFGDAADGAVKLEKGSKKLKNGASQLKDGIGTATDGATQLNDGAKTAAKGSTDLKNGIDSAAEGAGTLNNGAQTLAKGTSELNTGILSAKDGSSQLQSGSTELKKGTATLVKGLEGNTSNINALNDGAQKVNTGVGTLSAGLGQLAPGAQQVSAGVTQLVDGLGAMTEKVPALQKGVSDTNDGAAGLSAISQTLAADTKQLVEQINKMDISKEQKQALLEKAGTIDATANKANAVAGKLSSGTAELNKQVSTIPVPTSEKAASLKQGAATVAAGLDKMNKTVSGELAPGTKQLAGGTNQLASNWSSSITGAKKLDAGAGQLQGGLTDLTGGMSKLQSGSSQLADGSSKLADGTQSLTSGLGQLQDGSGKLSTGLGTLSGGTSSLVTGLDKLQDGSGKLKDGTSELKDGTNTLQGKLKEANEKAAEVRATQKTYDMVGEPVAVDKKEINAVPNYGTGFAPYFLSLGLFVGALLITIVFPLVEPAIKPINGVSWFASKVAVLAVVGLVQSLTAVAIVIWGLKLEPMNTGAFILMTILTSYTFLALTQMLVSILADPGRFVAILILILQLTTSAGTFPLELVPQPLHIFNTLLPMTYSVQGFKAAISTGDMSFFWTNSGILFGFMAGCLAITLGYFALIFKKRHSKTDTAEA